jgi:hypothetical protein
MGVSRTGQVGLALTSICCYVCWFIEFEEYKSNLALPLTQLKGDGLCTRHRARLQEGSCLFCGRRLAWLPMASNPELSICRPCFVQRRGESVALEVESMLKGDGIGLLLPPVPARKRR